MQVRVLGAVEVRLEELDVDLGTRKQRALLSALALHAGRTVPVDTLVDLVWGERPPEAVTAALQSYIARLRRVLEPDRAPRAPSQVLVTRPGGYALQVLDGTLDAAWFEAEVSEVHRRVGALSATPGGLDRVREEELHELARRLRAALDLWRGEPYAELEDAPAVQAQRARLEELRLVALEDRAVIELATGQHATAAAELESLVQAHPLRERLWGLRALALTRSGRQADALDALRQVRTLLAEELGLEPGVELRELQAAVLRQDPSLDWVGRLAEPEPQPGPHPDPPLDDAAASSEEAAWPLVGRDQQLAGLVELLGQAREGRPRFAVLTGEPGIGKSRLCDALSDRAREAGARVLVGRCSQDEGAPPLWPWAAILRGLGEQLPSEVAAGSEDSAGQFRAWEEIVDAVRRAAGDLPLLLVLDDLHWADASTLRVLRLLVETARVERLMVVTTWRDQPAPTGALAEVAEVLARRHAWRTTLTGLDAEDAGRVVASVADLTPSGAQAEALWRRTEGNPFFLVECARLAHDRGDLASLLTEADPPAAVQDVLLRRVGSLPEDTARALRTASVAGRQFDVATLALVLDRDEESTLDALEPALAAGLLREDGVDRFRFAHALVRDTLYGSVSRSRAARSHARFAQALRDRPERESEVARHWLAAGPAHAAQAWRACVDAARRAQRVFAYEEAASLLHDAVDVFASDPDASRLELHDLLVAYARALQLSGNWLELRPTVHRAIQAAHELDDLDRLVHAATMSLDGALWQASTQGVVDPLVVGALRDALDRLPPGDGDARCRVMIALAGEIYYAATPQERESLAEDAVAMSQRLGEPRLRLWCCLTAATSIWRGANAERRHQLLDEACALARELDDQAALSTALTLRVVADCELGRLELMDAGVREARAQAERQRHFYAELVLDGLEIPWLALRGDFAGADERLDHLAGLRERVQHAMYDHTVAGSLAMKLMWTGDYEQLTQILTLIDQNSPLPVQTFVSAILCRMGRFDEARDYLSTREAEHHLDTWFSPLMWAMSAESGLHLREPGLAAPAYTHLAELAGRPASTGSVAAIGPVDAFLAMAAEATGQRELATRHAEDALRLCERWEIPVFAAWFAEVRAAHGF